MSEEEQNAESDFILEKSTSVNYQSTADIPGGPEVLKQEISRFLFKKEGVSGAYNVQKFTHPTEEGFDKVTKLHPHLEPHTYIPHWRWDLSQVGVPPEGQEEVSLFLRPRRKLPEEGGVTEQSPLDGLDGGPVFDVLAARITEFPEQSQPWEVVCELNFLFHEGVNPDGPWGTLQDDLLKALWKKHPPLWQENSDEEEVDHAAPPPCPDRTDTPTYKRVLAHD